MQENWRDRVADIWSHAESMAEGDVIIAIDALVAERDSEDAEALFEAAGLATMPGVKQTRSRCIVARLTSVSMTLAARGQQFS